jgi:hypothetical protein
MATKLMIRSGFESQIPILEVAEPGYATDIRTMLIGDGSTTPPRIMTTKSRGIFDFRSTDLVKFSNVTIDNLNGFDPNVLNTTNGLVTRIGLNQFTGRSIVSGNASIGITNPNGVAGNVDIRVNPDLDLSGGTKGIILPKGTTDAAQRGANIVAKLRYAINPGTAYKTPEIFSVDGAWRALKEFIWKDNFQITIGTDFNTIQEAIDRHLLVDCTGQSIINFPEGTFAIGNRVSLDFAGAAKNWVFKGVTPTLKNILSVQSVAGTTGNWTVTYNVDDVTGINPGNYLMVDGLRGYTPAPVRGRTLFTNGSNAVSTVGTNGAVDLSTNFQYDIRVNDRIELRGQNASAPSTYGNYVGAVTATPSASALTVGTNLNYTSGGPTALYTYFPGTGTIYANAADPTQITGVGTLFTSELNVNDYISVNNQVAKVTAIANNTSLTVAYPFAIVGVTAIPTAVGAAVVFKINNNPELHLGTWVIVAIDPVNKRVAVINKNGPQPGANKMGSGISKILKTVLNFTNPADDRFLCTNNSIATFDGLVITSSTGSGGCGVEVNGGSLVNIKDLAIAGFSNGLLLGNGSTCLNINTDKTLSISKCNVAILANQRSTLSTLGQIHISACPTMGIVALNNSSVIISGGIADILQPWRTPLSCMDIGNTAVYSILGSYVYAYIFSIGLGNAAGVYCENTGAFTSQIGGIIHSAKSGFTANLSSTILAEYTRVWACTNGNGYFANNTSNILAPNTISVGNQINYASFFSSNLNVPWLFSMVPLYNGIYANTQSTIYMPISIIHDSRFLNGTNNSINASYSGRIFANNSVIGQNTPNGTTGIVAGLNFSYIDVTGYTIAGSNTTFGPALNTLGNANSMITG